MGNCNSAIENKQPIEEKTIEIDPNIVLPAPPQFKKCGADNLKIKPVPLNSNTIIQNTNNTDNNIILNNNINLNNNNPNLNNNNINLINNNSNNINDINYTSNSKLKDYY